MGFYEVQLICLSVVCAISLAVEGFLARRELSQETIDGRRETQKPPNSNESSKLTRKFLVVYAIVMGADWLQGPYVYSLYKDQHGFSERFVAFFFVIGFLSAGVSAPLVGVWADQHGRRKLCLFFCITYIAACVCITIHSIPILLIGRLLGGFSTSILFSAFESWLISEATTKSLPSANLSSILGRATLVNGLAATTAGVVSNHLVSITGNLAAPFIASGIILVIAWVVISTTWTENYGTGGGSIEYDIFQAKRLRRAWRMVRQDSRLHVLGLTQTCFEGSMYLFVFLWVPTLQEHTDGASLPFGYIFSSFMICMMLGSVLYSAILAIHKTRSSRLGSNNVVSPLTLHARLCSAVCAMSALALAGSVASTNEQVTFWAFCIFEVCVGMYYPVQGTLRGLLISNENRATLSSLFRVPMNTVVVVSLLSGVTSARGVVFTTSAMLLAFSSVMTGAVIIDRRGEAQPLIDNGSA